VTGVRPELFSSSELFFSPSQKSNSGAIADEIPLRGVLHAVGVAGEAKRKEGKVERMRRVCETAAGALT
jgi:hypothetical protein